MKAAYPIVLTPAQRGYVVYVPDLQINTEGNDLADALEMARDAISLLGITLEDSGKSIPLPSASMPAAEKGQLVSLVDVDFTEYRRQNDLRTVRRNVSLPSWLNAAAEKAGINVSAVLQTALKRELKISE